MDEKDELLAYLFDRSGIPKRLDVNIPRRSRTPSPRLSFAQERFWFLDQFEQNHAVYNSCKAERMVGDFDLAALEKSLMAIVQRHEVLRAFYPADDGRVVQQIADNLVLQIPLVDLEKLPTADRHAEARREAQRESQMPFNLSTGPVIRAKVLRLGAQEHVLLLTLHQIVFDSWSVELLFRELWTLYAQYSRGNEFEMAELPIQYGDFAEWQRDRMRDGALAAHLSYWKRQLDKSPSGLSFPSDRPRPHSQSFRGAKRFVTLPEPLAAALKLLSHASGVTFFMTLLAAAKILLYRYTNAEDLVVGCPMINRNTPELEPLIGSFVNTLVLRTHLSGNPGFREALSRVKSVCLGAYAHQDLPFEKLVEELQPQRHVDRNPLFQVMFAFQSTSIPSLSLPQVRSEALDVDVGVAKFDLTVSLVDRGQYLTGYVEYSSELFDPSTIDRMIGHFRTLLEGIVADPEQRISDLTILTEAERYQQLIEWNDTVAGYPKDKCIHELFEEQVEQRPNAVAVSFQGKALTYRQLNARANQLAHYLRTFGVGSESLVGICVDRSLEMVVGLLGILKAGGAYVPLDPSYPKERLDFMLDDAGISVLLTQEPIVADGRWRIEDGDPQSSILDRQIRVVCLDCDWPVIQARSAENLKSETSAENLAYVIYTSGSTGEPKGVQVVHRSVVNCLHSIAERVRFTDQDVLVAVTTISFDIAALELYLPLLVGAKLVIPRREVSADGSELSRQLTEYSATAMQATPSTWRLLLEAGWKGSQGFKILCGGEALSGDLASGLLACGALWNLYGPSETTIWSTINKVESGEGPVSIGRPINNTQIYILDSHLELVPIGVHGEIYIGGDGLARGYLNRPELTASRFVVNSFTTEAGARLYWTGDRARYRADGNMEFLGRSDNQVKIRGHRVELGEIETALNRCPAIKESVIVARDHDSSGEKDLVGYYVSRQGSTPSVTELGGFLREKLPEYLIPSVFMALDQLPLTPNGKVDRSALPSPDGARPDLDRSYVEPRTEIEELIAQVWREVLKLERVGVYDNFFELGGHSLLATRVAARLRGNFNIELPLRKLFELPTVGELAEHIEFVRRSESGLSVRPIVPVRRDIQIPASFPQTRLWFLRQLDPAGTAYNVSNAFSIRGPLDVSALEQALNRVVARHEILRTTFDEVNGTLVQRILPSLTIGLPVVDLTGLSEGERSRKARELALAEARRPFDLRAGPLLRMRVFRLGAEHHVFLVGADHVVVDGWSLGIFYQELGAAYDACSKGEELVFPRLPVQFADYAYWQHETLKGELIEWELDYWKKELAAPLATLLLPADRVRPPVQTSRSGRVFQSLSPELTRSLKELSQRAGATLFMTLMAACNVLLGRWAGVEDVIIGSTISGRGCPETEKLIGFFINALPLRNDLSGNPSFSELMRRVRGVCLDAYTHQEVPFEMIVEAVNPSRDLSRNPLFQVLFNFADISDRMLRFDGCQVTKEWLFDPEAKFDLTFYAPEKDGTLELAIVYNADVFDAARIVALLEQFSFLLEQVVEGAERPIASFSLVSPRARAILPDPAAPLDASSGGAIHEWFSRQAHKAPGRPALSDAHVSWTYGELDRRSNQLAHYLLKQGIKPKDTVAIYAQRKTALVVGLLAILKAGAAFVILDPAYPVPRLISYLRIARPHGWIHVEGAGELSSELQEYLAGLSLTFRLNLPNEMPPSKSHAWDSCPDTEVETIIQSNDPAYIAFTSGSTGEPKGVLARHGPMTHFLPWQTGAFELRDTDRFAMLSGLAYNHLHRDVFTPLALGARLHIPAPEIAREPVSLANWLYANEISILHLTPALGRMLILAGQVQLPSVRRIFFGGDVLTRGEIDRFREFAPNATIGSFYGATETQRAVGYYEIPRDLVSESAQGNLAVPLGRGVEDVQLLVLNQCGELAGIGELGELYVRSPHLAEGYVGDEALTGEKFIINPFTAVPNDRLYKTGEVARYLPDGNVEWAGRNDRQMNIRGFRVELGEIEAVLKRHPTVTDAAVVVREFAAAASDRRLVAYVAAEENQQTLADLLHSYVKAQLPDYMVPSQVVVLEHLPLSANGKIDYEALPALTLSRDPVATIPSSDVEARLCAMFCQVLGMDAVGIHENFFRLGGHSLLAAQAVGRIREDFGVPLELRTLFEAPTIEALAIEIELRIQRAQTTPGAEDKDREEFEI